MGISRPKAIIFFILYGFSLLSCQNKKMEEKYSWLGTISAPQEYPMEIYNGSIIANDFTYGFDAIWGTQNTGWGNEGGTMSVETQQMEIPHRLEFTWYSLVERKFFTGKWNLDQENISKLFKEGFVDQDTQKKTTYTNFIVGLAPKGRVVLWINGPGNQREVGVFQAHDTIITQENAYENAKYMLKEGFADRMLNDPSYETFKPEIKARIEKEGYPSPEIYDAFREKYNWKPVVLLPEGGELIDFGFNNYNGEQENLFGESLKDNTYKKRAVPKFCGFYWLDKNKNRYAVWIDSFDEKEIFELFQKSGKEKNIDLTIKINNDNSAATVSLKNGNEELPVTKAKIRLSRKIE
ncbi:MAG: hypothetical protein K0R77_2303 [Chryseobacterium sp.]|jgi:hypothetical protein|uniref:DUF2931 family protein n=1 Tax=Chryseobacterium sp. TaxID=1871047 RepID=UPI00260566C9|nr:DUF2931 family protein [Chryseobacterium sp.]MDF2553028.1 hypothetical protein [Chryseobacterium sp.]